MSVSYVNTCIHCIAIATCTPELAREQVIPRPPLIGKVLARVEQGRRSPDELRVWLDPMLTGPDDRRLFDLETPT